NVGPMQFNGSPAGPVNIGAPGRLGQVRLPFTSNVTSVVWNVTTGSLSAASTFALGFSNSSVQVQPTARFVIENTSITLSSLTIRDGGRTEFLGGGSGGSLSLRSQLLIN